MMDEFKRELQQSREKELGNSGEKKQKTAANATGNKSGSSEEDKPSPTPAAAGKAKPACKYGAGCTRKNPAHFNEYSHPK